jgi:hypothetical protein
MPHPSHAFWFLSPFFNCILGPPGHRLLCIANAELPRPKSGMVYTR